MHLRHREDIIHWIKGIIVGQPTYPHVLLTDIDVSQVPWVHDMNLQFVIFYVINLSLGFD
jgi:hypothetical protein